MLQRAATNAYSWWWASHIRTKQSKWLEQNLQDMEEKVADMLKIIEDDGDSFAKRAEMYYRKRPELINFVEEAFRAYRSLAERYDYLSKELQSANRTIASVFPEQVQLAMDEEDFENFSLPSTSSPSPDRPSIPRPNVPTAPLLKKDLRSVSLPLSRKGALKRTTSSAKAVIVPSSGLTKDEALEEIDQLQKEMLALQTEKEFVRSVYERGYEKYWEIENQVIEKQKKVCSLQDEFGIGTVIEDDEARNLMASRALKSCQESLIKMQKEQEQSSDEVRVETRRVREVSEKFAALRSKFLPKQPDQHQREESVIASPESEISTAEQERQDLDLLRKKIKEELEVNSSSSITMSQLAERIDDLVQRVVALETEVSSQNASVTRLRSETDGLQSHVRSLEEDKEALIEGSGVMSKRVTEVEEELRRVKSLVKQVVNQNIYLRTHFTEASCNLDHLSVKLQSVKMDYEDENTGHFPESKAVSNAKAEDDHLMVPSSSTGALQDTEIEKEENDRVPAEGESFDVSHPRSILDVLSEKPQETTQDDKSEKKYFSEACSTLDTEPEEMGTDEEDDQPNWRQLFLNGLDDREKILLEEYTAVLRNYKDVRKKLNDVEKRNRDGFFELAMQLRELKSAVASRDGEIQTLRQKTNSPPKNSDEDQESILAGHEGFGTSLGPSQVASLAVSTCTSPNSQHQPLMDLLDQQKLGSKEIVEVEESSGRESFQNSTPEKDEKKKMMKISHVMGRPHIASPVEQKVRSEIDELLEENLEFWLRFSTSFHQIQKYQSSLQDLKAELSRMKEHKKQEGSGKHQSHSSDARPIYKHLREIQTELSLWLENNAVLKDEVQGRYSSLTNIQEEISRVSNSSNRAEERELNEYQAAKFQGEILNMKQENHKVADELKSGFDRVRQLKLEVEKIMANLEEELGISASTMQRSGARSGRPRIPLRSFLFGVKLKNRRQSKAPSMFACMNPAVLQKQHSFIAPPAEPPQ